MSKEKNNLLNPDALLNIIEDLEETRLKLEENEKKMEIILNNVLDGIMIIDPKGKVIFANRAIAKLMELKSEQESIGKNAFKHIHPDSRLKLIKDFAMVKKGKGGFLAEYKIITSKKKIKWIENIGKQVVIDNKKFIVTSMRDITKRKKLEEKLKKYEFQKKKK